MHRFVQFGLSAAIAATFVTIVIIGTNVFLPHPDFGKERNACFERFGPKPAPLGDSERPASEREEEAQDRQERERACLEAIDAQEKPFLMNVFIISFLAGVVGVAMGALIFPKTIAAGATGMTFGGLIAILYGMVRALPSLDRRIAFLVALVTFAVLLAVAWKRSRAFLGGTQHS